MQIKLKAPSSAVVFILFLFVALVLYWSTLKSPFLFDDVYNIVNNFYVHNLGYVFQYFTDANTHNSLPQNATYRPLCTLVYGILWKLGGGSPWIFHVYKILLHSVATFLVFRTLETLLPSKNDLERGILALAAAIFLIHPANVETVSYISSTSSLQCAVLVLAAFYSYLRGRVGLMALFYLAAMFTKEEGVVLLGLVFVHGWIFHERKWDRKACSVAAAALATYLTVYFIIPKTVQFSTIERFPYLFTQFRAYVQYLTWIVWPTGFSIEHMGFGFSESLLEVSVFISLLILIALVSWMIFATLKFKQTWPMELRLLLFSLFWFFISLLPSSSVFPLSEPINEHRYYLSYALLVPSLVLFLRWTLLQYAKPLLQPLTIATILVLGFLTFQQTKIWQSPMSVWQNATEVDPKNQRAFLNLAVVQMSEAQFDKALENLKQCLDLNPRYAYCLINQGLIFSLQGNLVEAREKLESAYSLEPTLVPALSHLGAFYVEKAGKDAEGLRLLDECARLSHGGYNACYTPRSTALRRLGRNEEALAAARETLKRFPETHLALFDLGLSHLALDQNEEAFAVFQRLHQRNPRDVQVLHNLSWIEKRRGNSESAAELWKQKLNLESPAGTPVPAATPLGKPAKPPAKPNAGTL